MPSSIDGLPTHVCQLCLAAQDLGAALPSLAALPPVVAQQFVLVPESLPVQGRSALPPPAAARRAPQLPENCLFFGPTVAFAAAGRFDAFSGAFHAKTHLPWPPCWPPPAARRPPTTPIWPPSGARSMT
jgi:hypothetical protein